MNTQQIILTVAGAYHLIMGLSLHTKNFGSALIFKVIPFFLGLACLYAAWVLK